MNGALNVGITHCVEFHITGFTGLLRLHVEGIAGRLRVDVMGDRVFVHKSDDVAFLDGDVRLSELLARLLDNRRVREAGVLIAARAAMAVRRRCAFI